jgi:streptogramin lyase
VAMVEDQDMKHSAAEILREYGPFPDVDTVHGVSFDGQNVWFATGEQLTAFDPASGETLRSIDVAAHAGTAYDGRHLFQLAGDCIQKIDPETGSLLHEIPFPEPRNHGIFFKDGYAVVNETNNGNVYHLDLADGRVLEKWHVDDFEIHGMTISPDGRIWFCDATTNRIGVVE